jgi:hypothetical protein
VNILHIHEDKQSICGTVKFISACFFFFFLHGLFFDPEDLDDNFPPKRRLTTTQKTVLCMVTATKTSPKRGSCFLYTHESRNEADEQRLYTKFGNHWTSPRCVDSLHFMRKQYLVVKLRRVGLGLDTDRSSKAI